MFIKKIRQCELYPDRHIMIYTDDSTAFIRDAKVLETARKFNAARVAVEVTEAVDKATGLAWVAHIAASTGHSILNHY